MENLWSAIQAVAPPPWETFVETGAGTGRCIRGCGTGSPLIELAQRLGPGAHVHGVGPWAPALQRVRHRLHVMGVANITLHECGAEQMPLDDHSVDVVVSNNGFNNVDDLDAVLSECARVARPAAQLVYAYNLPGSMAELYSALDPILEERGDLAARARMRAHIDHKRKPLPFTESALQRAGFRVGRVKQDTFWMRFADAAALFGHFSVRRGFLPSWLEIPALHDREAVFSALACRLDDQRGPDGLVLTIPFACIVAHREGGAA